MAIGSRYAPSYAHSMSPETTFIETLANAQTADNVWQALETLARHAPGHILFTVMTVDMAAGLARRAFSNHPIEYPASGTKPIEHNSWFDIVHGKKRSFVANSIDEIAKVFPDHQLIASLGCGSVMNLPVLVGGELAATINMLAEPGHYTTARVRSAEQLLRAPARLCLQLAQFIDLQTKRPD